MGFVNRGGEYPAGLTNRGFACKFGSTQIAGKVVRNLIKTPFSRKGAKTQRKNELKKAFSTRH